MTSSLSPKDTRRHLEAAFAACRRAGEIHREHFRPVTRRRIGVRDFLRKIRRIGVRDFLRKIHLKSEPFLSSLPWSRFSEILSSQASISGPFGHTFPTTSRLGSSNRLPQADTSVKDRGLA